MFKLATINNKLLKNILVVASGTAGAQLVAFLFMPIITRLYGPTEYGELGVFISLANIVLPIITLGYSAAIILPKEEEEVKSLVHLSLLIGSGITVITLIVGLIAVNADFSFVSNGLTNNIFWLCLFICVALLHEVGSAILQRFKNFKNIATLTFFHSIINYGGQATLGLINPISISLILMYIFSLGVKSILIFSTIKPNRLTGCDIKEIKHVASKYKDFPLYRTPQLLINAFAQSLPVVILAYYSSPKEVGYYALARLTLAVPISLLGRSVKSVFYPHFNELVLEGKTVVKLLKKTTVHLAVLGVIPFCAIYFYGPILFKVFFGGDWVKAGEYASYLSLWLYFALINLPSVSIVPVIKLQKWYVKYEVVNLLLRGLGMVFAIKYFDEPLLAILVFALIGVGLNVYLIHYVNKRTENFEKLSTE